MFSTLIELQNVLLIWLLIQLLFSKNRARSAYEKQLMCNAIAQKSIRRSHCTPLSLIGGVIAVISRVMVTTKLVPRGRPLSYVRCTMKMRNGWWGGSLKKKERNIRLKSRLNDCSMVGNISPLFAISEAKDCESAGPQLRESRQGTIASEAERIKIFVPLFVHSRAYPSR